MVCAVGSITAMTLPIERTNAILNTEKRILALTPYLHGESESVRVPGPRRVPGHYGAGAEMSNLLTPWSRFWRDSRISIMRPWWDTCRLLREFQAFRQERQQQRGWYARHMKLRSMEFGPATPYECFQVARVISRTHAETVWVYESILPRVGRARGLRGCPAPTLRDLIALYRA